jgi:hypothetical protein
MTRWLDFKNKWLNMTRNPANISQASFWGPVGIAAGVIIFLNVFVLNTDSISFEPQNGLLNLVLGLVIFVIGLILAIIARSKEGWARVGLTSGLSVFSWRIRILNTLTFGSIIYNIGWFVTIIGVVLIILGFIWAPK